MQKTFTEILEGYRLFRKKYTNGCNSTMRTLSVHGQQPQVMVVACCDSRVDPALILQCDPGDLFITRNVANIVPPYERDTASHGTSAALEFGIRFLGIKHLILLGHSQCAGIDILLNSQHVSESDFIAKWVSWISLPSSIRASASSEQDAYAKFGLDRSYENCLTFPWIAEKIDKKMLTIHRWFFDIEKGQIFTYSELDQQYKSLEI